MVVDRPGRWFSWDELAPRHARMTDAVPDEVQHRLIILARMVLDPLRDAVGRPLGVTSGYRDEQYNRAIGGSATSDHPKGRAVDIRPPEGWLSTDLADLAVMVSGPWLDQVIAYHSSRGGHLHLSIRPEPRGEHLYAPPQGGYAGREYGAPLEIP